MDNLPSRPATKSVAFAGLRVDIYRPADGLDATNGGASSRYARMTIYPEHAAARDDDDVLVIVRHRHGLRAVPFALWRDKGRVMFGGHFCYSHDSRLPSEGQSKLPIKIFDRVEEAGA